MWYLVCGVLLAIWVLVDGLKRKANAILWALGTVFLGPIVLPLYLAKRPLQPGELREGGTTWNVLKNFAVSWTIFMAVAAVWGMVAVSEYTSSLQGEAEKAGAAVGTAIGLGMIGALWFFPFTAAVVIGFLSKKSSVVETGPAVPLAAASTRDDSSVAPVAETRGEPRGRGDAGCAHVEDLRVGILVLAGIAVLIAGCETQHAIEDEISGKPPELRVSTAQLYGDYEANEVAADTKYKGRIVEVSGTVKSIGKDNLDQIYVTLEVGESRLTSVQCFFSDAHKNRAAQLTKGGHVRIKGKCYGKFMNIFLKGCSFQ